MAFDLLHDLQTNLGFKCETIVDVSNSSGFTSFVSQMELCSDGSATVENNQICNCEIGVGGWMQTHERNGRVEFLPPLIHDVLQTTVNIDHTFINQSSTFFLTTFTPSVWIAIFGLFLWFTILKRLDNHFVPYHGTYKPASNSQNLLSRGKHWLLTHPNPFRLRRAMQSVGKFSQSKLLHWISCH